MISSSNAQLLVPHSILDALSSSYAFLASVQYIHLRGEKRKNFSSSSNWDLRLFSPYVLDYFHDRDPRMTRRWIVNFFFFISLVDSFVDSKIFIDSQLNSSVHQKKKKVSVAWSSYDFADFLGHSLCLVTHNSIIVIMPLSFFASFFFFFGHLCLFDVRVSSNHVAFDSWN